MFAQCFWSAGPGTRCVARRTAASVGLLLLSANEPGTLPELDPNAGLWLQTPPWTPSTTGVGSEPPSGPSWGDGIIVSLSSCAGGPLGIGPSPRGTARARSRWESGGSHVLLIQTLGWGGGRTGSSEPTSSLAFLQSWRL